MDVTISIPDKFAERIQRCGTSPEDYMKLLFADAMRRASARELKSRPADTQKFLDASAAEENAKLKAELLEYEAEARAEALRLEKEEKDAAVQAVTEQPEPSALPT
jgi:hypothetical protein